MRRWRRRSAGQYSVTCAEDDVVMQWEELWKTVWEEEGAARAAREGEGHG